MPLTSTAPSTSPFSPTARLLQRKQRAEQVARDQRLELQPELRSLAVGDVIEVGMLARVGGLARLDEVDRRPVDGA